MRRLCDDALRSVALVVTDRRWAAPLSAMALGFGLFLGIAIGPGASGGLATGAAPLIAVAEPAPEPVAAEEPTAAVAPVPEPEVFGEPESFTAPEPEYAPVAPAPEPEPAPAPQPDPEPEAEPETEAQLLEGTVVHANPAAQSYTMAIAGGELVSVHAEKLPAPGTRLGAEVEPLGNSTFGERGRERKGTAAKASFEGVVTYRDEDPAAPAYTVSGRGSSIPVHAADPAALPALGAYVKVTAAIEKAPAATEPVEEEEEEAVSPEPPACAPDPELEVPPPPLQRLTEVRAESEAEPATYLDLAGVLAAVCPKSGQLLLSADDLRQRGADVVLAVPKRLKTAKLKVGDSLLATAEVGEDGTLTLAGLASDEGAKGAADAASAQGDLAR